MHMAKTKESFFEHLAEELKTYGDCMVPVKAWFWERHLIKKASIQKLHPNPEDEFCKPEIGPNHHIISEYVARYRQYNSMKDPQSFRWEEPLQVEKVLPDGYRILNGHHRWAAYWNLNVKKAPISILNLTHESDIQKMLDASTHDKRATLDLDEVVFWHGEGPAEKPLNFLFSRIYKERMREGIPLLLHYLSKHGYDIWVYSSNYYSIEYIRNYFRQYTVKVDGIITGTARKTKEGSELTERAERLFSERYVQTLHIDRGMVLRTFSHSKEFEDYPIEESGADWPRAVMKIVKEIEHNEK